MNSECYGTQGTLYLCRYNLPFPLPYGFIDLLSLAFHLFSYFNVTENYYELRTAAGIEGRGRGIF
jgi:hypothetical protein